MSARGGSHTAQKTALTNVVSSDELVSRVNQRAEGQTDEQVASDLRAVLAQHGFDSADVAVRGPDVSITVTALSVLL